MAKGDEYLGKLAEACAKNMIKRYQDHRMAISEGIPKEDKAALLGEHPGFPALLMEIAERIDGTYFRKFGNEEVTFFFFGSDVDGGEYPHYLFSAQDIPANRNNAQNFGGLIYYADHEQDEKSGPFPDRRISFTPSDSGRKGQGIRFLHAPGELKVIADSFDDFLYMLMEEGFFLLHPDDAEWFA